MSHATVAAVEDVADRFRLVTLKGAAVRGATWTQGQKIQAAMGSAFVARTYTAVDWDTAAGRTRVVAYARPLVRTGKAITLRRLRQKLRREDVPATRIIINAYWAPGEPRLD